MHALNSFLLLLQDVGHILLLTDAATGRAHRFLAFYRRH